MVQADLTDHITELMVRARRNANKADGPFDFEYEHEGDVEANAAITGAGRITLSLPQIVGDTDASVEVDRDAFGKHHFRVKVRVSNMAIEEAA